ncbi:unnamed protein product [Cyprideis torosa]|uniref:Uncharacterized protein n=1 Tax=Cyprideis torosa TaxID=163714 RepID=A0A7R8WBJ5_9CRUS|nr:unnamed protein product [Cyprideis torosa]CAG0887431.1 unnamed protein product [Cyprideis torosa]
MDEVSVILALKQCADYLYGKLNVKEGRIPSNFLQNALTEALCLLAKDLGISLPNVSILRKAIVVSLKRNGKGGSGNPQSQDDEADQKDDEEPVELKPDVEAGNQNMVPELENPVSGLPPAPENEAQEEELAEQDSSKADGSKPGYSCGHCGRAFVGRYALRMHEARDHEGGLENDAELSKPTKCEICDMVLPFYRIYAHRRVHKEYPCKICGKVLSCSESLKYHLARRHDEGNVERVQCEICGEKVSRFSLKAHVQRHEPKTLLECAVCPKTFRYKRNLVNHQASFHGIGGKFMCATCGKNFVSRSGLAQHEKTHSGANKATHKCDICGKALTSSYNLKMHVAREHKGGVQNDPELSRLVACKICGKEFPFHQIYSHKRAHRWYPCDVCGKELRSPEALKHHLTVIHGQGEVKYVECEVCGKAVRDYQIKFHMNQYHVGSEELKCSFCSKVCVTAQGFKRHVKQFHSDDLDHVCHTCGKKCGSEYALRCHEKSHSDLRPFVCSACGKAYKYKPQLQRHVKQDHEGRVLFTCGECGKVYRTSHRLKEHVKKCVSSTECSSSAVVVSSSVPRATMVYIASDGSVRSSREVSMWSIGTFFTGIWNFICLFFETLFFPNRRSSLRTGASSNGRRPPDGRPPPPRMGGVRRMGGASPPPMMGGG